MHTLNEIVVVIPGGTAADVYDILIDTIAEKTGWTRVSNNLYIDSNRQYYLNFTLSGDYAQVRAYFNGGIELASYENVTLASNIKIRFHKSTNETVTYVVINDDTDLTFLYAENENGEGVLFRGYNNSYFCAGANSFTTTKYRYYPPYSNGYAKYSVAKYVDHYSSTGGEFLELYWVYSTVNPATYNQLISFDGVVMRLITMYQDSSSIVFAMPVSDEVEPEPEPESESDPEPETTE